MIELGLSIAAAAFYGAADFAGGLAARASTAFCVAAISQFAGFVLLLCLLFVVPGTPNTADILWGAVAGIAGGFAVALLYHALSIGTMGVVSPITAVLAAGLPVFVSATFLGERLQFVQLVGIVLSLVAIVMISMSFEGNVREISTRGVREALLAGIGFGLFFVGLAHTHQSSGLWNLFGARLSSIPLLVIAALMTRSSLRPAPGGIRLIVFSGVLDMSANVLYILATFAGSLSIAAVVTSLYPASTVALARVVLGERLSLVQRVGVGFALAGVALIALRS